MNSMHFAVVTQCAASVPSYVYFCNAIKVLQYYVRVLAQAVSTTVIVDQLLDRYRDATRLPSVLSRTTAIPPVLNPYKHENDDAHAPIAVTARAGYVGCRRPMCVSGSQPRPADVTAPAKVPVPVRSHSLLGTVTNGCNTTPNSF
ncbi:hypothetical protein EVAR_42674_1 [Eumeta japonica]|uniref:Uncharacterized protein n=1 Tax=Eumeta variegata TaxID=151549 RepID=A0A4C1X0L0_EUMVA|nr:hypothetical protein EVAR_42674_1 [Eumeta japonica]